MNGGKGMNFLIWLLFLFLERYSQQPPFVAPVFCVLIAYVRAINVQTPNYSAQ